MIDLASLFSITATGLLGSLHCAAMCGGFAYAVGHGSKSVWKSELTVYHLVRGLAYVTLGLLAGTFGMQVESLSPLVGLSSIAGPLMALTLVVMAWAQLRSSSSSATVQIGKNKSADKRPSGLAAALHRARHALMSWLANGGIKAAAAAGLLTALLPCGWLWSFVAAAAGTSSPVAGGLLMLAFWLGTLPGLVFIGQFGRLVSSKFGVHAPKLSAAALLVLAGLTLSGKLQMVGDGQANTQAECHSISDVQQ